MASVVIVMWPVIGLCALRYRWEAFLVEHVHHDDFAVNYRRTDGTAAMYKTQSRLDRRQKRANNKGNDTAE